MGLSTHSDSELITQALCLHPPEEDLKDGPNWVARIKHLMSLAPLSYSLVIMLKDRIFGVRDPYGNRPLCIGRIVPIRENKGNMEKKSWLRFLAVPSKFLDWVWNDFSSIRIDEEYFSRKLFSFLFIWRFKTSFVFFSILTSGVIFTVNGNCPDCNQFEDEADGFVISSESCGFLSIGARYVREVLPGEIVELTRSGVRSVAIVDRPNNKPQAFCIFEYVYFARSDSIFEGESR